jgi:histidine decarboxylase
MLTFTPLSAPAQVSSLATGEIDYQDLRSHLMSNSSRPAIINLNIGTTVRGAIDDVDKVWIASLP